MKYLLLSFSLIVYSSIYSQSIKVSYEQSLNSDISSAYLKITDSTSTWLESDYYSENIQENPFIIKHNLKKQLFQNEVLFSKLFYIKDTLSIFSWELLNDTLTILNHKCLSAKTNFRGRKYIAYYCIDLPYSDGPWKFSGLPGLILSVKSDDDFLKITAKKIELKNKESEKSVKYRSYAYISWQDYEQLYKITIDNIIKRAKSSTTTTTGSKTKIKIDSPEIIYPEVQTGEGIVF